MSVVSQTQGINTKATDDKLSKVLFGVQVLIITTRCNGQTAKVVVGQLLGPWYV